MQVSVYLQNWSHVLSYVNKAEATPQISEVITFLSHLSHSCFNAIAVLRSVILGWAITNGVPYPI